MLWSLLLSVRMISKYDRIVRKKAGWTTTVFLDMFRKKKSLKRRYHTEWDFNHIKAHFSKQEKTSYTVDDATWNDLDMDEVYKQIDRTTTTCGQHVLYDWLRRPLSDAKSLEKRERLIRATKKKKNKDDIISSLNELGNVTTDVQAVLDGNFEVKEKTYKLAVYLPLILIVSIIMLILTRAALIFPIIIAVVIASTIIHYFVNQHESGYRDSIIYMVRIIVAGKKLVKALEEDMPELAAELKERCNQCKTIQKKARIPMNLDAMKSFFLVGYMTDLLDYMFLIRTRNSYKLANEIKKNTDSLKAIFSLVGDIDAALSVATIRHMAGEWCKPTFTDEAYVLEAKGVFTPLLPDPIPNDIDYKYKGMMLTGSNMSGKSTYLRSVGQNVIFAQSIHTCFAECYHASFYHVMSSIRINDDITQGTSYYFSEAKRVLEIIEEVESETQTLVIIDEMLRGTNDTERRHICIEVLNRLAKKNCRVIIATHDTGIAPELSDYDYRFFHSIVVNGDLKFEYHMQEGVCPDGNAVDVIAYLGYPEDIVQPIRRKIKEEEAIR